MKTRPAIGFQRSFSHWFPLLVTILSLVLPSEIFAKKPGSPSTPPTITVEATDATAYEPGFKKNDGTLISDRDLLRRKGTFTLTRTGGDHEHLTVSYTITGTAENGVDYKEIKGTARFSPGNDRVRIDVIPRIDRIFETDETVILTLDSSSSYEVGSPSSDVVTILGNAEEQNLAPVVNAGTDQIVTYLNFIPTPADLSGTATDDGLPNPPGALTLEWTKISGPGTVTFSDASSLTPTVFFSEVGEYVLRLTATDGTLSSSDDVLVTVNLTPIVELAPTFEANEGFPLTLNAVVVDDSLPNPPGFWTTTWSQLSGPGVVTFSDASAVPTQATFSVAGTYVLRLSAFDGALTTSADTTVTVLAGNLPPTVSASGDATVAFPNSAFLMGLVSDDGQPNPPGVTTHTWSQVSGPGTVTFADASALITTASFSQSGVYVLRLTADDSAATGSADLTVTVNAAPVVNAGADQSIDFPASASLAGLASDDGIPAALTVQWTQVSGPGTATFVDGNAATTSVSFSSNGIYTLRLTANDGALSAQDDVVISVNGAPVVAAGADQTIALSDVLALSGTASDDGLPTPPSALTTAWTVVSGVGTVTFADASAPSTTTTFSQSGVYVLRLTANDGSLSSTSDVTITVNAPPVVSAGVDQSIELPALVSLSGVVTDDGLVAPTTVAWSQVSGPGTTTFADSTSTSTTASFSSSGVYTLRLTANDGALSAQDDVVITVNAANTAPVVSAGADQSISISDILLLTGTALDDGLPNPPGSLSLEWTMVSGTGTVSFVNANALITTATFSQSGVYVLRLTATDSALSSSDEVTITVNAPPVVNAGADQTIDLPASATLSGVVTDDGLVSPTSVVWSQVSGPGITTFGDSTSASTTASFSASGVYTLRLTANDGALSTQDDVVITVNPANTAPVVAAGADQTITLADALVLVGTASDDGLPNPPGALSVNWSVVSGPGTVTFANATSLNTTATFSQTGSYVLRLTADDSALNASSDVTITVNPSVVNGAPTVNAGVDQTISLADPAELAGVVSDDGLPNPPGALSITWSFVSGPGTVSFANDSVLVTTATFSAPGNYVLRLTANDGALNTSDEVAIVVEPPVTFISGAIAAGIGQTVVVDSGGQVWGWGRNNVGQANGVASANILSPVNIAAFANMVEVAAGDDHSIALKDDGTVWAFGRGDFGQIGRGTLTHSGGSLVPSLISNVQMIAAGSFHSLAIKNDGTAWAWGRGDWGQVGNTFTNKLAVPTQIVGLSDVVSIAGGGMHSIFATSDGKVYGVGTNNMGQLGAPLPALSATPIHAVGMTGAVQVAAGAVHSLALKSDGTVWGCGRNNSGQLGDNTTSTRTSHVQVKNLSNVVAIACGSLGSHTLALKDDGTVWAWGLGTSGQLGEGTNINRLLPVQVVGLNNVVAIGAGNVYSFALKSDGSLWSWGVNTSGQLGLGTIISTNLPTQVPGMDLIAP
jgi:alpha-tubulin suppressor-like RCC1 family protein